MKGEVCSLLFAVVFVPLTILGWMNILHSLRMRRVRRMYQNLPKTVRDQILDRIDHAGFGHHECCVLVAIEPEGTVDVMGSRYGGIPYAEAGEQWPTIAADKSEPADFLIQVLLDDTFPVPWPGRLIAVFNRNDVDQTVRSYLTPAAERYVALTGGPPPQREWKLRRVHVPRQPPKVQEVANPSEPPRTTGGLLDYDPVVLLQTIPELKADLAPYTRRPADLLAAVLAPNHSGYGFELSDIVQTGGHPEWLQFDLDGGIDCDLCQNEMRFLFQFGDLNGGVLLGDSGVCYVFGCDAHPDHLRAIVESC